MNEQPAAPSAAMLIIGNEILSGRTQDANLAYVGRKLGAAGIRLREARVVPDDEAAIVAAVRALSAAHTYVFTSGGIGPTHDDITAACVAKAFGRGFGRNPEAERRLRAFYGDDVNEARLRMANTPEGAELIDNPVSVAPGFCVDNVYVLAGVPRIMQAMVDMIVPTLAGGPPLLSRTVTVFAPESALASAGLGDIQARHPSVDVGSYPFMRLGKPGTSIVVRGVDRGEVDGAATAVHALAGRLGAETSEDTDG